MSNKSSPGYVWLLAGLAIGLFVALLVYLKKQPAEEVTFTQAVSKELKKVKEKTQKEPEEKTGDAKQAGDKDAKPAREPKFDFYTILPESEVFVPEPTSRSNEKPASAATGTAAPAAGGKQYLLQVGSFRNHGDADKLKASLALLGVTATIQSVTVNNDTWHRVRVGPFSDTKRLSATLSTLRSNNIQAMTMELK